MKEPIVSPDSSVAPDQEDQVSSLPVINAQAAPVPGKKGHQITDAQIEEITNRVLNNQRVRRSLFPWGRINIDRRMPFLCVYRRTENHFDGDEKLVMGEAAYLTATAAEEHHARVKKLVSSLATDLATESGAYLIVEVWVKPYKITEDMPESPPHFRIIRPPLGYPQANVDSLDRALRRIRVQKQPAEVEIITRKEFYPEGIEPLLSRKKCVDSNVFILAIEVFDVYRDSVTGHLFPAIRQKILRGLSSSIQKLVFDFTQGHTTYHPANYQSLGKRSFVKAVWDIDGQLASLGEAFDLLLAVTPTNAGESFQEFKAHSFEREPEFLYRPVAVEPAALKKQLYSINIERVEDPTMAKLFFAQQRALDSRMTLLIDRGTHRFLYESIQLFGRPSAEHVQLSRHLLCNIPTPEVKADKQANGENRLISAVDFFREAEEEMNYYRRLQADFQAKAELRGDIAGVMVSEGNLLIGTDSKIERVRAHALLQHEVGTHILTYYNGQKQPFRQLKSGIFGYEELQEGMAVLSEYLCGGLTRSRIRTLAGRVVAVQMMIDGATFVESFREMVDRFKFENKTAFHLLMRVYRGGGFTKDAIYLRGLVWLLDYFRGGGDAEILLVGKFPISQINLVRELMWRKVVKPPALLPRYMHMEDTSARVEKLYRGLSIDELAQTVQY